METKIKNRIGITTFKSNTIVEGVQSKKLFIVQRHPDNKLSDTYYYLTSMNDDCKNRNELISTVHNTEEYVVVNYELLVRN